MEGLLGLEQGPGEEEDHKRTRIMMPQPALSPLNSREYRAGFRRLSRHLAALSVLHCGVEYQKLGSLGVGVNAFFEP
jgi:hypothetical protein